MKTESGHESFIDLDLDLDPPRLPWNSMNKALSLKNVDHALCEFNKYYRSAQGIQVKEREYSSQKSRVTGH